MLRAGTQDTLISRKVNMPTAMSHAELVRDVAPRIKAQSFFSARVAEAHILEKLREVSDGYSRGEFGLGEARNKLKDFLRGEGYDLHQSGLRNLASTARLNLILKQNAAMANAAAEWKRMHDPDAVKVFPFVRYHARNDGRTRSEHGDLDGKIFRKDDPFLKTHTPPWEFNCRCYLEEITEKEAGRNPALIQAPTPEDQVKVESRSGFSFDPEHAFEEFNLESLKDVEQRRDTCRQMAAFAADTDTEITFKAAPVPEIPVCKEPENLKEIEEVIGQVKQAVDNHKPGTPYHFPAAQCSLGKIAKERFDAIGLQPEDDVEVIFESPGASDYGIRHWKKHHFDDWKRADFIASLLKMLRETIWNPNAEMRDTLSKTGKRIAITSPDNKYVANLWRKADKWVYSIQDAWDWSESPSKK